MDKEKTRATLKRLGAVRKGHFVYSSRMHGDTYVDKDRIYPHTIDTSHLAEALASEFLPYRESSIDVVVGPAMGGIMLAGWVAYHLTLITGHEVLAAYAEKERMLDPNVDMHTVFAETGRFVFKRGYRQMLATKRVLVVDNIVNTGASAIAAIDAVRLAGGNVVGMGALTHRKGIIAKDLSSVPRFESLLGVMFRMTTGDTCPLCMKRIPVSADAGRGEEFLSLHPGYPRA
jgi:orotate phosphoribosyltransferase